MLYLPFMKHFKTMLCSSVRWYIDKYSCAIVQVYRCPMGQDCTTRMLPRTGVYPSETIRTGSISLFLGIDLRRVLVVSPGT